MMYGNKKPMMKKKPMTSGKKGGMNKAFKTCATCPAPAKCKAMGKCMKKMGRK
tara:strand:+ start:731 stop:889 length:159 start_codon:yes stop_codon:yes gene_type:complete